MRIFKIFILLLLSFQLFLIFVTPYIFNTFTYNLEVGQKSFEELTQDPEYLIPELQDSTAKLYLGSSKKSEFSICSVHGFSASRMELEPVLSSVAKELKANIFFTRLRGHGYKDTSALGDATAQQWIDDVVECVEAASRKGEKIILIGTSMGAALSSLVAANTHYNIVSMILLAPYFGVPDRKSELLAGYYGDRIADIYFKGFRSFEPINEMHKIYWSTRYPAKVLKQLMITGQAVKKLNFAKFKMPILFVYSKKDDVIDLNQMKLKFKQIESRKEIVTDPIYTSHIFAGDVMNPNANQKLQDGILNFIHDN